MKIIYLKNGFSYYTDEIQQSGDTLRFETTTKTGEIVKHELARDQVGEITEMEGSVEEFRAKKRGQEK